MMVAMMLPALLPTLRRYWRAVAGTGATRVGRLVTTAGAAYFVVWSAAGLAVFPIGATLAGIALAEPAVARAAPIAAGVVLLICGVLQFTAFKAHALACCGNPVADGPAVPVDVRAAWRHGLRAGIRCIRCCANLMAVLLVLGVMDLAVMGIVTIAIAAERVVPAGDRVARAVGVGIMGCAVWMVARALA
jgi:predicted metal-binding membrane protein